MSFLRIMSKYVPWLSLPYGGDSPNKKHQIIHCNTYTPATVALNSKHTTRKCCLSRDALPLLWLAPNCSMIVSNGIPVFLEPARRKYNHRPLNNCPPYVMTKKITAQGDYSRKYRMMCCTINTITDMTWCDNKCDTDNEFLQDFVHSKPVYTELTIFRSASSHFPIHVLIRFVICW